MSKKRNVEVDIVRGLAIILMVIGHVETPAANFIYLFHMAVFFIASGYFYKSQASESLQSVFSYAIKKMKGLWLPYALWNAIFSLLRNIFIDLNVYTNNVSILETINSKFAFVTEYWTVRDIVINIIKGCILPGNVQMGGALWFLATLLQISIAYCIIEFVLRKFIDAKHLKIGQLFVSIVLLGIGYILKIKGIYLFGIESFFSCYCLFYIGMYLHSSEEKLTKLTAGKELAILLICLIGLCILNNFGSVGLGGNSYTDPIFMLLASLLGWLFLYEAAFLLKKNEAITKALSYIGKNTLPIVVLHFLAFKIVSLVGLLVCSDELYKLAAFPVLYEGFAWRVAYTIVGVVVPLLANEIWLSFKRTIKV